MAVVVRLFESWTNLIGSTTTGFDAIEFIFIGHIKTNVYKTKIKDLDDLKIRITREIEAIKKETIQNVFLEIEKR
jgi:hypothetical protein